MRWSAAVTLVSLAAILTGCAEPAKEPGLKALVGGRLEISLEAEPIPYSVVVVADGKIRAMGPQATTSVPKGAETISTKGSVIRPMPYNGTITVGGPANLMLYNAETGAPEGVMQNGQWL
jgi:hypothetical protein